MHSNARKESSMNENEIKRTINHSHRLGLIVRHCCASRALAHTSSNFNVDQDDIAVMETNLVERAKENRIKSNEKNVQKGTIGFSRLLLSWRPSHLRSKGREIEKDSIGIERVIDREAARRKCNAKKMCFMFSRSVLSQYGSKKHEEKTRWKALMSIVSISKLSLELASLHRLSFGSVQRPSWSSSSFWFLGTVRLRVRMGVTILAYDE